MSNHSEERKPIYKKWWFWAIIIVLIIGITGSQSGKSDTNTTSSTSESATSSTENEKTEYNQGEQAILGNGAITVTNVERSQGSEYSKPKSGKEYVIVSLKIENKGKDNLSYNPFYFKMQNSQGQQEDYTITMGVNDDTQLNSGELIPGGSVEGTLVFEEPKGDTGLILIYNDNLWSSKELKIKLQ